VSVSRRAGPPHFGHVAFTNSGVAASGEPPSPVSLAFLRKDDGKIRIRHRDDSIFVAVDHGNGRAPVTLARDAPISEAKRGFTLAKTLGLRVRGHRQNGVVNGEPVVRARIHQPTVLMLLEWAVIVSATRGSLPSGCTTTRTGRPYLRQNSKSRWSCAGTAMMAPVPYSSRTKFPTRSEVFLH